MMGCSSVGGTWPGHLDSIHDARNQNLEVRTLPGDLTYNLWYTEGSEMILVEAGDEGGKLARSGSSAGRRAAARR